MFDFKSFRKINNLKQSEAAEYFNCTQAFISRIERGISPVPSHFITKIESEGRYKMPDMTPSPDTDLKIEMPREIFEKISQLIDTVCSQQNTIADQHRTIDRLVSNQKNSSDVRPADNVDSAVAG
ncbi:MAG: helix-turn-helix transcriptional regulator [Alistipes senegalensis]